MVTKPYIRQIRQMRKQTTSMNPNIPQQPLYVPQNPFMQSNPFSQPIHHYYDATQYTSQYPTQYSASHVPVIRQTVDVIYTPLPILIDWKFTYTFEDKYDVESLVLVFEGTVMYNEKVRDGEMVKTSKVIKVDPENNLIKTESETIYKLGAMHEQQTKNYKKNIDFLKKNGLLGSIKIN